MAIITILFSCVLGATAGLFQLVFLDAGYGQAFLTYFLISMFLPIAILSVASVTAQFGGQTAGGNFVALRDEMEPWHDWQVEEEMEVERLRMAEPVVEKADTRRRA